jgi:ferric-dicitrate binding protein FerR (iron transport regulator)
MKHFYDHSNPQSDPLKTPAGFFQNLELPFERSREEVWADLDKKLAEKPAPKISAFSINKLTIGIAAAVLLLAGVLSLLRFYTTTVYCPPGEHLSYILPDKSTVEMNAESRMEYHPLWWRFNRKINFEGEGFFEVEKGKEFAVVSEIGRIVVLGTSFNIYSRDSEYKVSCFTGKVKVISFRKAEAVLSPEYEASVDLDGNIIMYREVSAGVSHAWVNNMFNFTSRPLAMVFNEIGRQYDVKITFSQGLDYSYTGYFTKNRPVEETLTLVCKPFGLTFVRISEKEYEISQN